MKKLLTLLTALLVLTVSAAEPGNEFQVEKLIKSADCMIEKDRQKKADFEVVLFFDALTPDTNACLMMVDALPEAFPGKKINLTAVARNDQKTAKDALLRFKPERLSVYTENEKKDVFSTYAKDEVLIPLAVVICNGKIRWKGMPTELESVLSRMIAGKYSFSNQVQIDLLRRDLQAAVQANVPEVILQSADKILKIDPADSIAIQAKLYVFSGRNRQDLAKAFLLDCVKKAPEDVQVRLVLLDTLINMGDRYGFREAVKEALQIQDPNMQLRVMAFALENAPFGWIPLEEMLDASKHVLPMAQVGTSRYDALRFEVLARLAYLTMDIDQAILYQTKATECPGNKAQFMLDYYKSVKTLKGRIAK